MSRRLLQLTNAVLGVMTILLAGASLLLGAGSPVYADARIPLVPALDSNLRFLGGLGIGLGAGLLWILPTIERNGRIYRLIWLCTLLGGGGRLLSLLWVGVPPIPLVAFTLIELAGVPLLIFWQWRVERAWRAGTAR